MTGYFLTRIQLNECRFPLAKRGNTEFVLQCSISWQYLTSKLQKVEEFQSGKSVYRQILNLLWNGILRNMIAKSDLSNGIVRLDIWDLGWCGGKGLQKKGGWTRNLQKSPVTVIGKYSYHCWWGMGWTFSLLLLKFLTSALSKWIFSPCSSAELFLRKLSSILKLSSATFVILWRYYLYQVGWLVWWCLTPFSTKENIFRLLYRLCMLQWLWFSTVEETCSMSHIQVLTLKEIKPVAFEVLLQYIYNAVLPNYLKFSAILWQCQWI